MNAVSLKKWAGRALLLLVGSLVGLLIAESALRFRSAEGPEGFLANSPSLYDQSIFQKNKGLGHILKPGSTGKIRTPEFNTEISINSLGFRGPEITEKSDNEFRIIVLGDSFTLALQVDQEDTFSKRLEQSLTEKMKRPVTVLNAGVDSYSTSKEIKFGKRLIDKVDADAVLLVFFTGNDFLENQHFSSNAPEHEVQEQGSSTLEDWIKGWSHTWYYLRVLRNRFELTSDVRHETKRFQEELLGFTNSEQPIIGMVETSQAMTEFKKFCGSRSCAVAIAPPAFAVHTERALPTFELFSIEGDLDLNRPAREVEAMIPSGIPVLDLTDALQDAAEDTDLYFTYDAHWTPEGHRIVAEALAPFLAREFTLD